MSEPESLDDAPGDLEGELSTVTDQEWREAHERLTADLAAGASPEMTRYLAGQMDYEWSPGE